MEGVDNQSMQDQSQTLTKQKIQALLIMDYRKAIRMLNHTESEKHVEGYQILIKILNNQHINDESLSHLKYSLFISLAEISKQKQKLGDALYYWYQSTKIGGPQSNFTTWLKIAKNIEQNIDNLNKTYLQVGIYEWNNQLEHAYKEAIKISPLIWRQKLVKKLLSIYRANDKKLQQLDLQNLIKNGQIVKQSFLQTIYTKQKQLYCQVSTESVRKLRTDGLCIIRIPLYILLQNQGTSPNWQYIYAVSFLLQKLTVLAETNSGQISSVYQFLSNKAIKKHENLLKNIYNSIRQESQIVVQIITHLETGRKNAQQIQIQIQGSIQKNCEELETEQDRKMHELILDILKYNSIKYLSNQTKSNKKGTNYESNSSFIQSKISYSNKNTLYQSIFQYVKDVSKNFELSALKGFQQLDHKNYTIILGALSQNVQKLKDKQNQTNNQKLNINQGKDAENPENNTPANYTRKKQFISEGKPKQIPLVFDTAIPKKKNSEQITISFENQYCNDMRQFFTKKQQQVWYEKVDYKQNQKMKKYSMDVFNFYKNINLCFVDKLQKWVQICRRMSQNITTDSEAVSYLYKQYPNICIFAAKSLLIHLQNDNYVEIKLVARSLQTNLLVSQFLVQYLQILTKENQNKSVTCQIDYLYIQKYIRKFSGKSIQNLIHQQINQYKYHEVEQILRKCSIFTKLYTLPYLRNNNKIDYLIKIYKYFYKQYQNNHSKTGQYYINYKQPQKLLGQCEARINKSRLRQLAQQPQESALNSIDQILKSDLETSQSIESLKMLLLSQESQNSTGNLPFFLKSFLKILELLFNKIDNASDFPKKFISSIFKALEIPAYIDALYKKLTKDLSITDKTFQKDAELSSVIFFLLIKTLLLNQLDSQHMGICLRIIFFLYEYLMKKLKNSIINQLLPKKENTMQIQDSHKTINSIAICQTVIFLNSVIKTRESADIRKKFIQRVLSKTVFIIYDPRFSSLGFNTAKQNIDEYEDIRHTVYQIYNEAYQSKYFKSKKIEDCIGYFILIGSQFSQDLQRAEVDFDQKIKKIFNQCYLSFESQYDSYMKYCTQYKSFVRDFIGVMNRQIKPISPQFLTKCTGNIPICQCCQQPYLNENTQRINTKLPKDILFVVGKYIENRNRTDKKKIEEQAIPKNFICQYYEDQRYYMDYLMLNIKSLKAWKQILRSQIAKVYEYFDALIGVFDLNPEKAQHSQQKQKNQQTSKLQELQKQSKMVSPMQMYKHKFLYSKIMANFILKSLIPAIQSQRNTQQIFDLKKFIQYRTCLINTVKIGQRKLYWFYAKMLDVDEYCKDHQKKYIEGVVRLLENGISSSALIQQKSPVQVQYIQLIQFSYPLLLYYFNPSVCRIQIKKSSLYNPHNKIQYLKLVISKTSNLLREITTNSDYKTNSMVEKSKNLQLQVITDFLTLISEIIMQIFDFFSQNQLIEVIQLQNKLRDMLQLCNILQQLPKYFDQPKWINILNSNRIYQQNQKQQQKLVFDKKYQYLDYVTNFNFLQQKLAAILRILKLIKEQNLQLFNYQSSKIKKKTLYLRYVYISTLTITKIILKYGIHKKSYEFIKQLIALKGEDLIYFYHHYQNQSTQQNQILAEFYSRAVIYHHRKMEGIELMCKALVKQQKFEIFFTYLRKIGKMYIHVEIGSKQQIGKSSKKHKQSIKQKEIPSKEEQRHNSEIQLQKKEIKKKNKDKENNKKNKDKKTEKKNRWLYVLYLRGVSIFMEQVQSLLTRDKKLELDQRCEKALVQFKNRIKREAEKQKKMASPQISNLQRQATYRTLQKCEKVIRQYQKINNKVLKAKNIKKGQQKYKSTQKQIKVEQPQALKQYKMKAEEGQQSISQDQQSQIKKYTTIKNEQEIDLQNSQSQSQKQIKNEQPQMDYAENQQQNDDKQI